MKRLYIFNPEHDLALASGSANYQAPESALFLASDLATLPKWFAEAGSVVFDRGDLNPYSCEPMSIDVVEPWGWDLAVRRLLIANGIDDKILPSVEEIAEFRQLSHRKIATRAMNSLRSSIGDKWELPSSAAELYNLNEVSDFVEVHGETVLKAPWSSSGRGVYWLNKGNFTPSMKGWIKRVIEKQGSIMAEVSMKRKKDFAMEFKTMEHKARFMGYSLFFTEETGAYRGNMLMSNDRITEELKEYIAGEELDDVKTQLLEFLENVVAPIYSGSVGVDMFIYQSDRGEYLLNPVVEINMRMTMGMVARVIYDRYVDSGSEGVFMIEHKSPGRMKVNQSWHDAHEKMEYTDDKRMKRGYLSLCPVTENTLYRASISVKPGKYEN